MRHARAYAAFTFHYGSILISSQLSLTDVNKFTFHYGSILILRQLINKILNSDLHSTMVLF